MAIHRLRASVVVVYEGKLLGFHAEDPTSRKSYFFLPGGAVEAGESPEATAVRETLEETGYRIRVHRDSAKQVRYEFFWNGEIYESDTWFYRGDLLDISPSPVDDASYHRGTDWVPLADIERVFSYHPVILAAVQETLATR